MYHYWHYWYCKHDHLPNSYHSHMLLFDHSYQKEMWYILHLLHCDYFDWSYVVCPWVEIHPLAKFLKNNVDDYYYFDSFVVVAVIAVDNKADTVDSPLYKHPQTVPCQSRRYHSDQPPHHRIDSDVWMIMTTTTFSLQLVPEGTVQYYYYYSPHD